MFKVQISYEHRLIMTFIRKLEEDKSVKSLQPNTWPISYLSGYTYIEAIMKYGAKEYMALMQAVTS
jgi:hypothetical protein